VTVEWLNKRGEKISMDEWARLYGDDAYRRIAATSVGPFLVSTVWLGLNHNWNPDSPPLVFETMVFDNGEGPSDRMRWRDLECSRYPTEVAALAGHDQTVASLVDLLKDVDPDVKANPL
jgi:hypothetical protein